MIAISDNVQVRKDQPSGTIIINRPNRRNALSREVVAAIQQGLEDLYQENQVRAVILTGTGNTFSSGADLQEIKDTSEDKDANQIWHEDVSKFQTLIEYILRYPKPVICAVNGWTVGSGIALMLASDIVIAASEAKVKMPEANLGLFSGLATALLSFRIGSGQAAKILLTGSTLDAEEGTKVGVFQEQVESNLLWARCQEIATQISSGSRQSHQLIKQMLNETVGEELFTQLSIGSANTAAARTTEIAQEGVNAFLEKRSPNW
ncbi:MAG: enoyl-CoA hydratase/isomerase family protein [Planctomycetota bacterium]